MQHFFQIIGKAIVTGAIAIAGLFGLSHAPVQAPSPSVGATVPVIVATFQTSLQASISASATSMILVSATDKAGNTLSGYTCFNLDEGTSKEEFVCGTASGVNVTGMIRGISPTDGDLEVTALKKAHARGGSVKVTNYPSLAILSRILNGDETIPNPIKYASGIGPLASSDLTDKEYVLSVVSGGAVTFEKVVLTATAGETVAAGNLLYLKSSDSRWWKADADASATSENVILGIAQGSGTAGNSITGGVLISGIDSNQSGLTANTVYYVSNTAGGVSSSAGTKSVTSGIALSTTSLALFPAYNMNLTGDMIAALAGNSGTPSSTNKFVTEAGLNPNFGDGSDGVGTISGTTTLTSDMYYTNLSVTGTLNTAGYRVFVSGTLSGNGTIQNNGNAGSAGTPGAQGAGGIAGTATVGYLSNSAGSAGGAGPNTGAGVAGNAGIATSAGTSLLVNTASQVGASGGSSTGATGGAGGASGAQTGVLTKFGVLKYPTLSCLDVSATGSLIKAVSSMGGTGGGSGGSGNGSGGSGSGGAGGGGGASGGTVALYVNTFTGTTTIKALGGAGGNGASGTGANYGGGGGGGGGNGGYVLVVYGTKTWTGSYVVTGGTGGTGAAGAGTGSSGGTGTTGASGASKEIAVNSLF